MKIEIDENIIDVIIERKKIKNMYLRIDDNLNIYVTANKWTSDDEIARVIKKEYQKIAKMYYLKLKEKDNDMYFTYLGIKYDVIYEDVKNVIIKEHEIYTKNDKMLDKFYLNKCNEIFNSRLSTKLLLYPNVNKVSLKIRKMKTRWGVCNRRDNTITLNSELLKKDVSLIDYVIVHELTHFKHPNHQKAFWEDVAKNYPYYKEARKMLKDI